MSESQDDRITQMRAVQKEAFKTFIKKNKDYGDAFANYGPVGVIVRIGDKISRLISVTSTGVNLVEDETIRDTLMDLYNYSAMAVMLMDEGNDNTEEGETQNLNIAPSAPSPTNDEQDDNESTGTVCKSCTYQNNSSVTICEMCYNEL